MKIASFKQTGVHEMLILLLKEEMKISEITKTIHSQSAYRSISLLKELGLISVRRGEYNQKFYCLTDKGKKVAAKLAEIEEILQED
jgi:DNA-binding PadR family transcriptional regulator